jgi:hypothetical protein
MKPDLEAVAVIHTSGIPNLITMNRALINRKFWK